MGISKSRPKQEHQQHQQEESASTNVSRPSAITAHWMTVEEQERQIAAGIQLERHRVMHEARRDDDAARAESDASASASAAASDRAISILVDRYISNEMVNNPFVPDFIERRIYKNIIKLVVGIMTETLDSSNIVVLGHRVTFNIVPQGSTCVKDVPPIPIPEEDAAA